jgi:hypothetical protein
MRFPLVQAAIRIRSDRRQQQEWDDCEHRLFQNGREVLRRFRSCP